MLEDAFDWAFRLAWWVGLTSLQRGGALLDWDDMGGTSMMCTYYERTTLSLALCSPLGVWWWGGWKLETLKV